MEHKKIVPNPKEIPSKLHVVKELPVQSVNSAMEEGVNHEFITVEDALGQLLDQKDQLDRIETGVQTLLGK